MFTGIITHIGKVTSKAEDSLVIASDYSLVRKLEKGMSISVNGVCLTVLEKPTGADFAVEVMPETLKRSMLGRLGKDDLVNLELPVTAQAFLSGHLVQGHVDGIGVISEIIPEGNSQILKIGVDEKLDRHIVEKGFIAVNGISLTVIAAEDRFFTVGIIPFTWKHTMLHTVAVGTQVNIEIDILAKYIEKMYAGKVVKK